MIRDHRPYHLKKLYRRFESFYVDHFLSPQLESLGRDFTFMKPWCVELFGRPIRIGDCVNVIAAPDMRVRLAVWSQSDDEGGIDIADYCLICPGVRIGSAVGVRLGNGVMLANGVYITDSDWHDLYDRVSPGDNAARVVIEDNAWIGDGAIVCKGVRVGRNSVVGAGSVVVGDVPPNTVAAGNPARVVKELDPDRKITTRAEWFESHHDLPAQVDELDRKILRGNTTLGWLRHLLFPAKGD